MGMDISLESRMSQSRLETASYEQDDVSGAAPAAAGREAGGRSSSGRWNGRRSGATFFKRTGAAALGAAMLAAVPALWGYFTSYETTDDAQISGHIVVVSSRIEGTVAHVYVRDTQDVKAGQLVADLDPRDREVALASAQAQIAQAEAQVESAKADYEAAITKVTEDTAVDRKARADEVRYVALLKEGVASHEEYEQRDMAAQVAVAGMARDRAAAASARKAIVSKEAVLSAAKAARDHALLDLSYAKIVAPVGGVIGKRTVETGQHVQAAQELLAVIPLDDVWVTANFKETQVQELRPRQRVTVHVDALGRDYEGHIDGIGAATGEAYSLIPPENAAGNYVKVVQRIPIRISLEPGQDRDHRLVPGMSVEPMVWLR